MAVGPELDYAIYREADGTQFVLGSATVGKYARELADANRTAAAVRAMAARVPTYVTLKDVKKRWGHGQEDVYPIAQFEKLWGDMTGLAECTNVFAAVPRQRGQQLKDQAQLDSWARDGSAAGIEVLCCWSQNA